MINSDIREREIHSLKKELMKTYVIVMFCILSFLILLFIFYLKNDFFVYFIIFEAVSLITAWLLLKNRIGLEKIARVFFIIAPLYSFVTTLHLWSYSISTLVWLVPIPIGAYVFFPIKQVIAYSLYTFLIIILLAVLSDYLPLFPVSLEIKKVRLLDIFLFICNIFIVTIVLFYKSKIRSLEIVSLIEKQEKIELPVFLDLKETKLYKDLFLRIEGMMIEEQVFKDPDLNISSLSTMLKVSNSYISRAIRHEGYSNFNAYLNGHRITYVVNMLKIVNLEKVTLFYIYSEAGYKNQSTFNRAFKDFKGETPSQYLQNMKE